MTSEAYTAAAAEALEKSGMATHNTEAMRVHAYRASVLLGMAHLLAEREAADLAPPEPVLPAAFLDCHDWRWEQVGDPSRDYVRTNDQVRLDIDYIREAFGPLRAVE